LKELKTVLQFTGTMNSVIYLSYMLYKIKLKHWALPSKKTLEKLKGLML